MPNKDDFFNSFGEEDLEIDWSKVSMQRIEKMYAKFMSPEFKFADVRSEIIPVFQEGLIKKKLDVPSELNSARNAAPQQTSQSSIDLTGKTIRNPETDNDILVKTALKYDPSQPVRKSAEKLIQKRGSK